LYSTNRKFATRVVHTALRGVTRDRLDRWAKNIFNTNEAAVEGAGAWSACKNWCAAGRIEWLLVSQGLGARDV